MTIADANKAIQERCIETATNMLQKASETLAAGHYTAAAIYACEAARAAEVAGAAHLYSAVPYPVPVNKGESR